MDVQEHWTVEMRFMIVGCVLVTILIFGTVLPMLLVQEVFADHGHSCGMSLRSYIYDSEWREAKRKSAEGQYYPGDGFNILIVWRATKCLSFSVETPETYGNVVLRSMVRDNMPIDEAKISNYTTSSYQKHFELKVIERETDDGIRYSIRTVSTDTPSVWNVWAENDESQERFKQAVESRCSREPGGDTWRGCVYGHVELDTVFRDKVCYDRITSLGETIEVCSDRHTHKVVFKAKGKAQQCKHQKDPPDRSCSRPYFKYTETERTFNIRQPHINMTLERDPFHDIYGFSVMNQDETFYIDDMMGIRHEPVMRYVKNGPVQFVVEVKQDLQPAVVIDCVDAVRCNGAHNHTRTDSRDYPQTYGHGKRGYHTLGVGDYSFTYTISAYNIGNILEHIVESEECDKYHRDKLPKACIVDLSRKNEGWGLQVLESALDDESKIRPLGINKKLECDEDKDEDDDCNWIKSRLLNVTSGTITIHVGPYEPVVKFYGHSIWETEGIIPPDAETGVTATYFGSTENDVLYPERRMRIDGTHVAAIAYNSTAAIVNTGESFLQPYDPLLIVPGAKWVGFDSHEGNYTTIEPRTMMESAGYGTVRLTTDGISEAMLRNNDWPTGISNTTGYFVPYTNDLGNRLWVWLNNTSYTYPAGYHSIPLNITVYNSDGIIKPSIIDVSIFPINDTDRTFQEYIEIKVGEEQNDEKVTEIVGSYVAVNHTVSTNTGQLISYIPRLAHVYYSEVDTRQSNGTGSNANLTDYIPDYIQFFAQQSLNKQNETETLTVMDRLENMFDFVNKIPGAEHFDSIWGVLHVASIDPNADMSLPLHLGTIDAANPSNITVYADGTEQSWGILDVYAGPIDIIVNTEHDNEVEWVTLEGLPTMKFLPTFGITTSLSSGNETLKTYCYEECTLGVLFPNTTITARNIWNGTATSTYELETIQPAPKYDPVPTESIFPINEITFIIAVIITALVVIWKLESGKWPIYG